MGLFHSPRIVTNGLVLCLDAGNRVSYPGSGTTWFDMTTRIVGNGTLDSTNTFFSDNGGYILTRNNGIYFPNGIPGGVPVSIAANSFTINAWVRPKTTHEIDGESTSGTSGVSGQAYFIYPIFQSGVSTGAGISLGTNGVSVYEHSDSYLPCLLAYSGTISNTTFTNITVVYRQKQPMLYINGANTRVGLTSARPSVSLAITNIGGRGTYGNCNTDVAITQVYSSSLSDAEITQNYNALRGRFGI